MNLKTINKLVFILVLVVLPLSAEAATAIARVSANIVPITSLGISGSAVFSGSTIAQEINGAVKLTYSGVDSTSKLKIRSGQDNTYDISVALPSDPNDEFKSDLNIVDSQLTVINKGGLTAKGEREFDFGGAIEMVNVPNDKSRTNYIYVTANFN